jgi:hypothetical protein
MKKHFLLLFITACLGMNAQSEKALERSKQTFETAKGKPLYVVLDAENEKHVAKLTKKGKTGELQLYRKLITSYNSHIKSAVHEYLMFFPEVKYISSLELKELKKEDFKTINILVRTLPMKLGYSSGVNYNSVSGSSSGGGAWQESRLEDAEMDTSNVKENSVIEFRTYDSDEMMPILSQPLNKLFCTKGEVYFAARQLQRTFNDAIGKLTGQELIERGNGLTEGLKTKTLMINRNDLKPGVSEEEIKKVYPYKFKVVDAQEFDSELTKKNETILLLFPISFPIATASFAGLGSCHAIYDSNTEAVNWPHLKKCAGKIEPKHFDYYVKPLTK